jgi:hypothetical protein
MPDERAPAAGASGVREADPQETRPQETGPQEIEAWFVWYGVPHFVEDFHQGGDFLRLFSPRLPPVLALPGLRRVTWIGLQAVSLLRWAGRRIWWDVRHLPNEASRALPMLAVLTILGFFSSDLWHVASDMGYLRLAGLLAFLVAMGIIFLDARLPKVIEERLADEECFTPEAIAEAWRRHSGERHLNGVVPPCPPAAGNRDQFGRDQVRNMRVYLLLCQVIQVTLLSVLVWGFFLILGRVAFTSTLLAEWFPGGLNPVRVGFHGWSFSIPFISTQLLRASALMAILSSIIFAVQAVTDDNYQDEFFAPTVDGLIDVARIRCAYLELRGTTVTQS